MSDPTPRVERAWAAVDERRLLETAQQLIRLPSVNPLGRDAASGEGEQEVAAYVAGRCERLGMAPETREHGPRRQSVIARLGHRATSGFRLMLNGHLDTVQVAGYEDPFAAAVEGGRLRGRGACDMKGALACFLEVCEVLHAMGGPQDGQLLLVATADEEFAMTGSRSVGQEGPAADGAIVGEPTGLRLCTASRGRVSLPITTTGRAAHTSAPEGGVNAVTHMAHILIALERHADTLRTEAAAHPLLGTPRLAAGPIAGGEQVNQVPDLCRLEIDRRTLPGETTDDVYAELRAVLDTVAHNLPDLRVELGDPTWLVPAGEVEAHDAVATALGRALAADGHDPEPTGFPGGYDGPFLGAPAVICGPGSLEQAHSIDEYIKIDELRSATRAYLHTALTLFSGQR